MITDNALGRLPVELQNVVCEFLSDESLCSLSQASTADRALVDCQWETRIKVSAGCARRLRRADVSLGDRFGVARRERRGALIEAGGRLASRKALHSTLNVICKMISAGTYTNTPCELLADGSAAGRARLALLGQKVGWRALYAALHRWKCARCTDGYGIWLHLGRAERLCQECAGCDAVAPADADATPPEDGASVAPAAEALGGDPNLVMISVWFNPRQALAQRTALRGGVLATNELPASSQPTDKLVEEVTEQLAHASALADTTLTHAATDNQLLAPVTCGDKRGAEQMVLDESAAPPAKAAKPSALLLWGPKQDFLGWMDEN
jgi:hypothetical protein